MTRFIRSALVSLTLTAVGGALFASEKPSPYTGMDIESLVRVPLTSPTQVQALVDQGLDVPFVEQNRGACHVVVTGDQLRSLQGQGFKPEILVPDLAAEVRDITLQDELGTYHTYNEMVSEIKKLEADFPAIFQVIEIGKSFEGRVIYAVKVSDNVKESEEETRVLFAAGIHSREWISFKMMMHFTHHLAENYAKAPEIKYLVDNSETYIIPIYNPDGVTYSQTKYQMWRKNRSKVPTSKDFGVDCNRNFGYKWGTGGSSSYSGSDTYMGPKPWSEDVTSALKGLEEKLNFHSYLDFHSYSELILYPWGWSHDPSKDDATNEKLAKEMAVFNKYTPQPASDLYIASGVSIDYMYGERGAWAYTFELATSFIPPEKEVPGILAENLPAALHYLKSSLSLPPTQMSRDLATNPFALDLKYLFQMHRKIGYLSIHLNSEALRAELTRLTDLYKQELRKLVKNAASDKLGLFTQATDLFKNAGTPKEKSEKIGFLQFLDKHIRLHHLFQ